jgi:hypothetical protein
MTSFVVMMVRRTAHSLTTFDGMTGWFTYQVHDHRGEVRFEEVAGEGGSATRVQVSWLVSVRPWFGFGRA